MTPASNPHAGDPDPASDAAQPPGDCFATTRWSVVLSAGRKSSPDSDRALEELCRAYWQPLYAFVRRQGHSGPDAEDLVQSFFARFLERNDLEGLAAERGRFRSFLLASLRHFLSNARDHARRQKRGGGIPHLSLDWQDAESRLHIDPADPTNPERLYDREWALALLQRVIHRLAEECAREGRRDLFAKARGFLTADAAAIPYPEAAADLGMAEGTLRVAVHRLRKRYRDLLRDEISQTLADPAQTENELRALLAALTG